MPHAKITAVVGLMLLFAASAYPAFSQGTSSSNCSPGSPQFDCEVRRATDVYFALLKAGNWNALSRLGLETRNSYEMSYPGTNLSLRLLEQLLGPLKIEDMTYTVIEVTGGPEEAQVRYSMGLRATDPRSQKTVINVVGAQRVLEWKKVVCNCPEIGMIAWLLKRDAFSTENVPRDYARARSAREREFVLIGLEKSALENAARVLQQQGIALLNSGAYQEAFKIFSQAQEMHKEIENEDRFSSRLDVEKSEQQIKSELAGPNKPLLASLLNRTASSYAELKENERARNYFEASLQLYKELGDRVAEAEAHKELAELYLDEGDSIRGIVELQKSIDQYTAAVSAGTKLDESASSDLADVAGELFVIYELQGRDTDAAKVVEDVQQKLPDEYKALFIIARGVFQWLRGEAPNFGDYEKAFELLDRLPRTEGGDVEGGLAGISILLSLSHSMQGDYTKAARDLQRARQVILKWRMDEAELKEFGDMPQLFVRVMEGLFYGTGSTEEALESNVKKMLPRVAEMSEASQASLQLGEIDVPQMLYMLSMQYLASGKPELSLQCLEQAQAIAAASEGKLFPILIQLQLALYYSSQDDYPKVIEHLKTGMQLSEVIRGSVFEAMFGRVMFGLNTAFLASTYEQMENYSEARKGYQKLLELFGPFTLFNCFLHKSIAETYFSQGKYSEAAEESDKAIVLARKAGLRYALWEMYQLSGRARWWQGERALARRDLEASVAEIEAMRRTVIGGEVVLQRFFEDKLSPYYDLVELLVQEGDCTGAFNYAERSKSRVLLDALQQDRKYTRNIMSPGEREEEVKLRRRLIISNRLVAAEADRESSPGRLDFSRGARAEARLDYELFRAKLYVTHPELASEPVQETIDAEGLRDLLNTPDTALLEYVVTGHSSYLFVMTAESDARSTPSVKCWVHPLKVGGADLEDKVNDFRVRVGHPEGVLHQQARELYDLLLRPAQQQIAGKKTLIIVPDGILWDMPLQALKPTSDRYLLQDSVIYYAPSFSTLQKMRQARQALAAGASGESAAAGARKQLTLLAIGNPLLSNGEAPLRGTGELAKRIEGLYGKSNARVYTEGAADEERIKSEASNYQVIHIGTHGVLDNENPMYSYVSLFRGDETSEGPPQEVALDFTEDLGKDGFLEAWEIMDLELNAQVVVLSACETARGRVGNGEGLVGLSWSVFIAGSPATVVSQWKVAEQGTNELMYSFHENYVRGALSPQPAGGAAAALQKASLKLMESTDYKHPYYWAGFVVIGDGR